MRATVDGNEATASVAYRLNEVCCIYPITPSSPMGEWCDEWSVNGRKNLWGAVPSITEPDVSPLQIQGPKAKQVVSPSTLALTKWNCLMENISPSSIHPVTKRLPRCVHVVRR